MKLLVVESDYGMREAYKELFKEMGFQCVFATHKEALATLLAEEPTHILYDADDEGSVMMEGKGFWNPFKRNIQEGVRVVLCGFSGRRYMPAGSEEIPYLIMPARKEDFREALLG